MTVSAKLADWSLLEEDGVMDVAEQVARKVAAWLGLEADDMLQDAYVLLATRPEAMRRALAERELAGLSQVLMQDLSDQHKRGAEKAARTESYDALVESGADQG